METQKGRPGNMHEMCTRHENGMEMVETQLLYSKGKLLHSFLTSQVLTQINTKII